MCVQVKVQTMSEWFKKNGTKAQKFAHIEKQADSHKFLSGNLELVCEHLASYLVIYCVDLAVDPEVCSGAPTKTSVKEKERGLFLPWLVACVCVCVRVCAAWITHPSHTTHLSHNPPLTQPTPASLPHWFLNRQSRRCQRVLARQ